MNKQRNRQQGVVLLIALTVLVAMSLAGVALMRSVDNTVVIAGNLAFKQSSVQLADIGTNTAVQWLNAQGGSGGNVLYATDQQNGYYAAIPADEPDWFSDATWDPTLTYALNNGTADAQGNVVRYIIHRMCVNADTGPDENCIMFFPVQAAGMNSSKSVGAAGFASSPQIYYRVTTRVEGPRNNITVVQSSVLL